MHSVFCQFLILPGSGVFALTAVVRRRAARAVDRIRACGALMLSTSFQMSRPQWLILNLLVIQASRSTGSDCDLTLPLVSWFGACEPEAGANTVFSVDPATLVASHRRYGTRGFLHIGLVAGSVGSRIWNISCELGACDKGTGCGFDSSGLLQGWEGALQGALDMAGPALANGSIAGVFLGDELASTVHIPHTNITAVAIAAKARMAKWRSGGLIALNEGKWALNDTAVGPDAKSPYPRPTPCWLPRIPAAVDLFSFDLYVCSAENQPRKGVHDSEEPRLARQFFEKFVRPKLSTSTKVVLVPGVFADPDTTRSGSLASQDKVVEAKVQGYADWMRNESHTIVGLSAWKWSNDKLANGSWNPSYGAIAVGGESLPRTAALIHKLARPDT